MKSCVLTEYFSCDPHKVWLYLANPMLNGWRTDLSGADISSDGLQMALHHVDGSDTVVQFTRKETSRAMEGEFVHGRLSGLFAVILLGGQGDVSLECTLQMDGLGLLDRANKHLRPCLALLHDVLDR